MNNEIFSRWLNLSHGFELEPDINKGYRGNENGILYLAEYVMCLHEKMGLEYSHHAMFEMVVNNLRHEDSGVYNRGAGESNPLHKYYYHPEKRRTVSQDNITAIACGSYLLQNHDECVAIAKHGLRNFFVYNNIKPLFRFPMNPGNYSPWLAMGGYNFLYLFFIPFYIINFIITMFKPTSDTSSKKLYVLELYALRNKFGFKYLRKILIWRLKKQYGEQYLKAIYTIYYRHPEHPLRTITN